MKKKKAFTLVEMIITVALVGVISTVMSSVFANGQKQYRVGSKRIKLNEKAALAVRDFEKTSRGATSLISADPNNFSFYAYLKADSHPAPSKISYYLDNGVLYRSLIPPVVSEGDIIYQESDKIIKQLTDDVVSENIFNYFNDVNSELELPIQNDVVRMVKISIEIDDDINSVPESAIQATAVQFRNLKNNL